MWVRLVLMVVVEVVQVKLVLLETLGGETVVMVLVNGLVQLD